MIGYGEAADRFLVIGQVGYQRGALLHRESGRLWFEDEDDLVETTHDLATFIRACLRDVAG